MQAPDAGGGGAGGAGRPLSEMQLPAPGSPPVAVVHVSGDTGYVWNAVAVRRLRENCRLVGAMVGALAGFRQQDAVHGLPLQLQAEEITLAVERGWVLLAPAEEPEAPPEHAGCVTVVKQSACTPAAPRAKKHRPPPVSWGSMAKRKNTAAALENADLVRGRTRSLADMDEQPWKRLSEESGKLVIALSMPGGAAPPPPVTWDFPRTTAQAIRYRVFVDLHTRGYTMTSGAKFGGDFLAYPGDPLLYHAQYTVRCLSSDAAQHPLALAAAARMAHAARKHVVLASLQLPAEGLPPAGTRVDYLTLSPDIQQSTNRDRPARGGPRGAAAAVQH